MCILTFLLPLERCFVFRIACGVAVVVLLKLRDDELQTGLATVFLPESYDVNNVVREEV